MPETDIKDIKNNKKGTISLPENVFGLDAGRGTLHASVVNFLANQRQGTHATKTKGLVSGGGKKPWKQKHTGRARSGSNRSPIWRGGGTIFGPQPRDYSYSLPRKLKKKALGEALSAKFSSGEITVFDGMHIEKPKTKDMLGILRNFGLDGKTVLIVLPERDENILLSSRNIPGVKVMRAADINPYAVMTSERLLVAHGAIDMISEACKI